MRIAIAGFGAEGRANFNYFSKLGHEITIADERTDIDDLPADVPTILGEGAFSRLQGFDMVVRTAGLAPHKISTDSKIWSSTNEFFARCPAPIIGVTGTKGKGTTASMAASMLRAAGHTVHLLGNIGVPSLEVLPKILAEDIVVFEMSSFQLWDIEKSPQVAVVLMIEPDHLNVHVDFDDYIEAKANIRRFQTLDDVCFYHPTNLLSRRIAMTDEISQDDSRRRDWEEKARRYGTPEDGAAYIQENTFFVQDKAVCPLDALQLPGFHNQENACAAMSAVRQFTTDDAAIERGLREFTGLPHRLELVREFEGARYYNDSFSSAPGATIAAIRSFDVPEVLIIGGIDKGADFDPLVKAIKGAPQITDVLIIGEIRHKLTSILQVGGVNARLHELDATSMTEIVQAARAHASPGGVVLLSPGCASFDMFKNFYDRGDRFRSIVQAL